MDQNLIKELATSLSIKVKQVESVLELLTENTVPFIARYRKELTGALDEEQIREIHKAYEYRKQLQDRKADVIRLIDEKGMLTEDLKASILKADKLIDVEDLYRPYKEKKKTKATEAVKMGLEPLADYILSFPLEGSIEDKAKAFITDEVSSVEDAITGAQYIIAEKVSDNPNYRKWIREFSEREGKLVTSKKRSAEDKSGLYEMYYEYQEPLKHIKLFRVLAINRAEKEKVLTVKIEVDETRIIGYLTRQFIENKESISVPYIEIAIQDGYKRLIKPSIEREIRSMISELAENQAIHIFSENLRSLLLQPPMKGKRVLGVDPAYRTGCKLVAVDETGKMLKVDVIYPHQKYPGENVNPERIKESKAKILAFIKAFDVDIVAIGNGTASRETESFIAETIKESKKAVFYTIVSEAGASVYSASELAKHEFPDLVVEERSAVSIARRLQDPLSELVKIDPQAIGVGQYQHDVTQSKLKDQLDFVVETAVNQVGVNVNTASAPLLAYVSGLSLKVAENVVTYREEKGGFTKRNQLLKVPGLGPKGYEQAVGFLRILNGANPLDKTGIHPESYDLAKKLLQEANASLEDVGDQLLKLKFKDVDVSSLANKFSAGEPTIKDVIDALILPLRDLRDDIDAPILKQDVLKLDDLKTGMELDGTVRNVVDFGVFVDVGLKNDGLVHISQLSNSFVKHPLDVVKVGDIVKVWVKDIDMKRNRLQLTMIKDKL